MTTLLRSTLRGRTISPHTLRHTTAMHLLQSGVDLTVIALWLGHENPVTTHGYIEADLAMKERAMAAITPLNTRHSLPPDGRAAEVSASALIMCS
ncbi:tyrosine-type recombinase/integrase [Burkholderia pseudomallei]|uniref:tyrosine-type recombinase/integrase n=1 Tax=Burkholderia pseudomallei TaxID=28450 RepID=UPI001EEEBF2D|nr:tyrosine-type recombinase/integrase [Burkholderia pseudomallei]